MNTDSQGQTGTLNRREQFRAYMKAFNPTAPAREMILAGLVVDELHGSLYRHLASRADLEPGSQQLIVGGIGSGKTTELLLAEKWLRAEESSVSLYIDITSETDLSGFNSGALLAGFGRHLYREVASRFRQPSVEKKKAIEQTQKSIAEFCYGKTENVWVPYNDEEPDWPEPDDFQEPPEGYYERRQTPGKLKPPLPALARDLQGIKGTLDVLLGLIRELDLDVVVIFDGLDRLLGPEKFFAVAHQDFRILRSLGVSLLATAPISILYGTGQTISEQFERVHHLAPVPATEPMLHAVLRRRSSDSVFLSEANAAELCDCSGGVLRDLITLARDAGEEAYVAGADRVREEDVKLSAQQLGTAYLRGLGPEQIRALWMLNETRSLNLKLPSNLELLVTRRVIEYSSTDFRVHPALLRVLPKSGEEQES
jgi:hypothetical protein